MTQTCNFGTHRGRYPLTIMAHWERARDRWEMDEQRQKRDALLVHTDKHLQFCYKEADRLTDWRQTLTILAVGFPAPWPESVSTRTSNGLVWNSINVACLMEQGTDHESEICCVNPSCRNETQACKQSQAGVGPERSQWNLHGIVGNDGTTASKNDITQS